MSKFKVGDKVRILSDAKYYKPTPVNEHTWGYTKNQLELVEDESSNDIAEEFDQVVRGSLKTEITRMQAEEKLVQALIGANKSQDMVNHPAHYTAFPIELKDWHFAVMQTIKDPIYCAYFKTMSEYLHRAHLKNGLEDIKKLLFWGNELVKHVEDGKVEVK